MKDYFNDKHRTWTKCFKRCLALLGEAIYPEMKIPSKMNKNIQRKFIYMNYKECVYGV